MYLESLIPFPDRGHKVSFVGGQSKSRKPPDGELLGGTLVGGIISSTSKMTFLIDNSMDGSQGDPTEWNKESVSKGDILHDSIYSAFLN